MVEETKFINVSKRLCNIAQRLLFAVILHAIISKAASYGDKNKQLLEESSQNLLVTCPKEDGGGVCPPGNTCCPLHGDDKSGCIPNTISKDKLGVCCSDGTTTGCSHGYSCNKNNKCVRDYSIEPWKTDPLAEVLPRYELCSPPDGSLYTVYGLPVPTLRQSHYYENHSMEDDVSLKIMRHRKATATTMQQQQTAQDDNGKIPKAIYHSTHGDITSTNSFPKIKMAFVIVHGAGRNADDYFCTGTVASSVQNVYPKEEIIVLSPRFASPIDSLHHLSNGLKDSDILKWEYAIDGTWRYGASAITPPCASMLSSYDVMDEFIEVLANRTKFPALERISVAGHSSGGQFVQRWSLTSSSSVWNDEEEEEQQRASHDQRDGIDTSLASVSFDPTTTMLRSSSFVPTFQLKLYAIVANPSSYAYLDNRRYIQGKLQVPPLDIRQSCPTYNSWEWGLDVFRASSITTNNTLDTGNDNNNHIPYPRQEVPYVSRAIQHTNGTYNLAKRYIKRNVLYLSGSLDRCNITRQPSLSFSERKESYWCDSHGLETTCVDELQGKNRWERSENYFRHLKDYFQMEDDDENDDEVVFRHDRWIVEGVGHDPSLMFTSDVGSKAIFGG